MYIYSKEPPKKEGSKPLVDPLDKDDDSAMKSAVRNAVLAYHTDKNMGFGTEWYVLCEEIMKELNAFYAHYKGED